MPVYISSSRRVVCGILRVYSRMVLHFSSLRLKTYASFRDGVIEVRRSTHKVPTYAKKSWVKNPTVGLGFNIVFTKKAGRISAHERRTFYHNFFFIIRRPPRSHRFNASLLIRRKDSITFYSKIAVVIMKLETRMLCRRGLIMLVLSPFSPGKPE